MEKINLNFFFLLFTLAPSYIIIPMGSICIFIFSANDKFVGGRLNGSNGDEACADLNVHTFHHVIDID